MGILGTLWRRGFWNPSEKRLRAGWRIGLHLVVTIAFLGGIGIIAGLFLSGSPSMGMFLEVGGLGISLTLATFLAARWIDRRSGGDLGLNLSRAWWLDLGAGLALGVILMTLIFIVELSLGWIEVTGSWVAPVGSTFAVSIWTPILAFGFVGFYEELLSRGYHLVNLAEGFSWLGPKGGLLAAWLLSSAIFGLLHAGNPNATVISTLNIGLAGILLGVGMVLTGRLAMPIGLHITWNLFQGNVFGFPVSGTRLSEATVLAIRQQGPDLWTGGPFGPEAGLIGLFAMALGIGLSVLWVRWREGRVALHQPLAIYDATLEQQ